MTGVVVLLSTCTDEAEGERIASALVTEHLAACVNIIPGLTSIYRWRGAIERASEVLLLIKTTEERRQELEHKLAELHSYETPEILVLTPTGGSAAYLNWVRQETTAK